MRETSTALAEQLPDLDIDNDATQDNPGRFINRELSWLEFNRRVYEEAW